MFAISLNIDPEKLKDVDKKNKASKKGSKKAKKTKKAQVAHKETASKDAES